MSTDSDNDRPPTVRGDNADPMRQEVWCGVFLALADLDTEARHVALAADLAITEIEQRGLTEAMHRVVMRQRSKNTSMEST